MMDWLPKVSEFKFVQNDDVSSQILKQLLKDLLI